MHLGRMDIESTHVDAIQAQHRGATRVTLRETPGAAAKGFDQPQPLDEQMLCAITPVVEIPRNDQRRTVGSELLHTLSQGFHLPPSAPRHQPQMHADTMQHLVATG